MKITRAYIFSGAIFFIYVTSIGFSYVILKNAGNAEVYLYLCALALVLATSALVFMIELYKMLSSPDGSDGSSFLMVIISAALVIVPVVLVKVIARLVA
ncbi:hypothetical protein [Thiomonas sp. FB-6]|uniref:hypothetical protein n=1 Tax=Thiomonas sp. FB-6 TaxID=1158291 RepID=UPI00036C3C6E|nr:hypothetical protein [Thiomonas sp. FB-6]